MELGKNFVLDEIGLLAFVRANVCFCTLASHCGNHKHVLVIVFSTGEEKGATPIILFDSWEQRQQGDGVPQCNCKNKQQQCLKSAGRHRSPYAGATYSRIGTAHTHANSERLCVCVTSRPLHTHVYYDKHNPSAAQVLSLPRCCSLCAD